MERNILEKGTASGIVVALIIIILLIVGIVFFTGSSDEKTNEEEVAGDDVASLSPVQTGSVVLGAVGTSGVTGEAIVISQGDQTAVQLMLLGTKEDGIHPAHIHTGTCEAPGAVVYPLTNVEGGQSLTILSLSVDQARSLGGSHVVNVHLSETESDASIACGPIVLVPAETGDGDESLMDGAQDDSIGESKEDSGTLNGSTVDTSSTN